MNNDAYPSRKHLSSILVSFSLFNILFPKDGNKTTKPLDDLGFFKIYPNSLNISVEVSDSIFFEHEKNNKKNKNDLIILSIICKLYYL